MLRKRIIDRKNIDRNNPYFKIYISLTLDEFDRTKLILNSINAKRVFDKKIESYKCL